MSIDVAPAQVSIGWIVSRTLWVIRRRAPALAALAALLICGPQWIVSLLPGAGSSFGILASLPAVVFFGAVALIAYNELAGGASIGGREALEAGVQSLGGLFLLNILSGLGEFGGFLLLVLPGLFLMTAWMPATAVLMVERQTATRSLGRAWALTRGDRWRLGGLLAIYLTVVILVGAIFLVGIGLADEAAANPRDTTIAAFVISPIILAIAYVFSGVGCAAAYVALRQAKEGPTPEIASVFA